MDNRVRKMVVVDRLVHKYDEILCSVHHGGHPASRHGPPVGEGHGGASPKYESGLCFAYYYCTYLYTVVVQSIQILA